MCFLTTRVSCSCWCSDVGYCSIFHPPEHGELRAGHRIGAPLPTADPGVLWGAGTSRWTPCAAGREVKVGRAQESRLHSKPWTPRRAAGCRRWFWDKPAAAVSDRPLDFSFLLEKGSAPKQGISWGGGARTGSGRALLLSNCQECFAPAWGFLWDENHLQSGLCTWTRSLCTGLPLKHCVLSLLSCKELFLASGFLTLNQFCC